MKHNFLLVLVFWIVSLPVAAFVSGTHPIPERGIEASFQVELMRGLAGPENRPETEQTVKPSVTLYKVAGAHDLGELGILKDIKLELSALYYSSAEEKIAGISTYDNDFGWILGSEISANFVHEVDRVFGFFIRNQNPISMNISKFVNPKTDRIGIGIQSGFKFSESWGQESVVFVGSGVSDGPSKQNAALSASLLAAHYPTGRFFPNGGAFKVGPFYEGDFTQRDDSNYGTRGIRAFRLGLITNVSYGIGKSLSVDLAYIQKFTGAYFRATTDFLFTLRMIL